MSQRGSGVDETERLESLCRRLGGKSCLVGVQARYGVEKRPVEQLLVQPAHEPGVGGVVAPPRLDVLIAGRASEPAEVRFGCRQQVSAPELVQLKAMLHRPQEAVRRRQLRS